MPLTRLRRRLLLAFAVLLIIGIVTDGAVLVLFSRSLDGTVATFCSYERGIYAATLTLPQVPGRLAAERTDRTLMRQLGCPQGGNP